MRFSRPRRGVVTDVRNLISVAVGLFVVMRWAWRPGTAVGLQDDDDVFVTTAVE